MSDEQPVRLHCFAHSAADGSAFDHWPANAGPGVEVVPVPLPGGEQRRREPPVTTHEALLADLLPVFAHPRPGPWVLYGHGLGALAAFTLTRALHATGRPGPALLAVGACPPPHAPTPAPAAVGSARAAPPRAPGRTGAAPPAGGDDRQRATLPAVLHTDLQLARALHQAARQPSSAGALTTPLLVVASQTNPLAPPTIADGWRQWTEGPSWLRIVPDHHFFARGGRELPRLLGRACRVARRLAREPLLRSPAGMPGLRAP